MRDINRLNTKEAFGVFNTRQHITNWLDGHHKTTISAPFAVHEPKMYENVFGI